MKAKHSMQGEPREVYEPFGKAVNLESSRYENSTLDLSRVRKRTFRRGSDNLLEVKDVLYVLGLMKNLLLVSQMEDKGLTITFDSGRVLIYPRGASSNSAKVIGVRRNKLI